MDFGKLSSSEKMAVYAAVAVVILSIYSLAYGWGGLMALPLIGGLGVLAVIFIPQMSPNTSLPGSRGSLLLIAGGTAAVFWTLSTLVELGYIFNNFDEIDTWIFLVGFAAALWLGWQCWQAFKSEGGTFRLGSGATSSSDSAAAAPQAAPSAPPPAATPSPAPPAASEPVAEPAPQTAPETAATDEDEDEGSAPTA